MSGLLDLLASPAVTAALLAGLLWRPLTGFPTWSALARGRFASTVAVSFGGHGAVFVFVQRLLALAAT